MTNENLNPFMKENSKVESPAKKEADVTSGRKVIDETTSVETNYVSLPKKAEIGQSTPEITISVDGYYNQEGIDAINKTTQKSFYTGLEKSNGERAGEFIIEGLVDGALSKLRLTSWELVYKMSALVNYCRENNYTLAKQKIKFRRVNEGQANAGVNWELHCISLGKKFTGKDSVISDL